jgi:hypothetical protein
MVALGELPLLTRLTELVSMALGQGPRGGRETLRTRTYVCQIPCSSEDAVSPTA